MYGGSFDPLHKGHVNNIIKAASMCKRLFIVISYAKGRELLPLSSVFRSIYQLTSHLENVSVLTLEDSAASKLAYNDHCWNDGAQKIKEKIEQKIDVVFCGSDYQGKKIFERLYPESEIYYFDRSIIPISSTEIRRNPLAFWDYLAPTVKAFFTKRVLIIGSESTGKSTLTQNLALLYNTNFVEEVGRETCALAGGENFMNFEDLVTNLLRQKDKEMKALMNANRILFLDTDALTTKFYANFLLLDETEKTKCNALADAIADLHRFDLILFLEPSVAFIQDGTRNEKIESNREFFSNQIKELFIEKNIEFVSIDGNYSERFEKARALIESRFGI